MGRADAAEEVLRQDYIRTARSKGLIERRVSLLHALKNAALPMVPVSAWSLARLLGGTIIIEKSFLVPGMGTLLLDSLPSSPLLIRMLCMYYISTPVQGRS